jgi:phosphomannomutase
MRQIATLAPLFGADLGAALNVDGDRIGFVTGEGTALSEEYSLPLVVTPRLRRRPGPVVTSYSTSGMVEALARSHGQRVIRGPVGESHVVDLGLAEEAVLAGEGSGGIAILPLGVAYDGLLALGLVLEEMATSGRSLAELVEGLPRLFMRKQELPCPPTLVYRVIERFRRHHAGDAPDCTDGVRLSWHDAWLHVRASGTEPLLRIIAEAPTPERAEALVDEAAVLARRITFGHEGS